MLEIIANNPFRTLGVYSNSKQADIVKNVSKMKAYFNVGRSVDFPTDIQGILPNLNRTIETTQAAQAAINLPNDKIRYALFWFCNADAIDNTGLNNLVSGDIEKAQSIFLRKDSFSSLVNRAVLALIQSDFHAAYAAYSLLVHDYTYRGQFCATVCGETFQITEDNLAHLFLDELLKVVKVNTLLRIVTNGSDVSYVRENAVQEIISHINNEIAIAKNVSASNAPASLRAGRALIKNTRSDLSSLRSIAGVGNIQYQSAADNLAKQILQCGINYYNSSNDNNSIDRALEIQEYALSLAVGRMIKDRCQRNVDILREKKEREPYEKNMEAIAKELESFKTSLEWPALLVSTASFSLEPIRKLINNCVPYLDGIKQVLGPQNEIYLKVSSAVVNCALGELIKKINLAQGLYLSNHYQDSSSRKSLFSAIDSAANAMDLIGRLDMLPEVRSHFSTNYETLKKLKTNVRRQSVSSSSGCYIATMVYGDYDKPQVKVLREFRDVVLSNYALGRWFIRFYYRHSPLWVEHLKDKRQINNLIRFILDKFISIYKHE